MKNYFFTLLMSLLFYSTGNAQVGIGTINPKGQLDVTSTNLGLVVPRVAKVEDVSDGGGNAAVDGTVVFDISRKKICYKANSKWICIGVDNLGNSTSEAVGGFSETSSYNYIKASNTGNGDLFGFSISISANGELLAIGAPKEDSNATGINGNQANNSATDSGAVYVYVKSGNTWVLDAYLKASNTESGDEFGFRVSLNENGDVLAVGAKWEDSAATGINSNEADNSASQSGAVYVFSNSGGSWTQEAYIKASNTDVNDLFSLGGVSLDAAGTTLIVGAHWESSNAVGVNGDPFNNSATESGAVYVFIKSGGNWTQEAYIKASNAEGADHFGNSVSLSADGKTFVVGARYEKSNATGINGNQSDNSMFFGSGAVYVFTESGGNWMQDAYIKASNTNDNDQFGFNVTVSGDGQTFVVAAIGEDSSAIGLNGNQTNDFSNGTDSGAIYVFTISGSVWVQEAYLKASNTNQFDNFGFSTSLNYDGTKLAVGAYNEDSNATGIGGNHLDNSLNNSGCVYSFQKINGNWSQEAYIKASNTDDGDEFGYGVILSAFTSQLAVGAISESSNATGVGGDQTNNSELSSGAVYIIE